MQDRKATAAPLEYPGQRVIEAYQVQMEQRVQQVVQEHEGLLAIRAALAPKVRSVPPVLPDPRVRMALLALRGQPAPPASSRSPRPSRPER